MLNTFVIALREGLEASLIIGILMAYLVKSGRRHQQRPLWIGVSLAIALSLAFGALLSFTSAKLTDEQEELFAGATGIVAVALVTWMIYWMRSASKGIRRELEEKASKALSATGIAIAAFVAVIREGLETSLFLYTTFRSGTEAFTGTVGLILGLAVATGLGYGIYRGAIRFNLGKFFAVSGIALILVAANVLDYSLHELSEVGLFPEGSAGRLTALVYVLVTMPPFIRELVMASRTSKAAEKASEKLKA
jgi:high-affinity iron transporter